LIRATCLLVAATLVANLLFGFPLEQAQILGIAALKGIAILVAVWFLGSWIGSRVRRFGQKLGKANSGSETLFNSSAPCSASALLQLALSLLCSSSASTPPHFSPSCGAAGLAIALALQDTLKAVAAGVVIAVFRPYRIGDAVRIAGQDGTVADITPFTTVLNTIDNREVVVTNDKAWGDVIINSSVRSLRRLDLLFSIDYDDDLDKAIRLISDVLKNDKRIRDEPPVWVKVVDLATSSGRHSRARLGVECRLVGCTLRHHPRREARVRSQWDQQFRIPIRSQCRRISSITAPRTAGTRRRIQCAPWT